MRFVVFFFCLSPPLGSGVCALLREHLELGRTAASSISVFIRGAIEDGSCFFCLLFLLIFDGCCNRASSSAPGDLLLLVAVGRRVNWVGVTPYFALLRRKRNRGMGVRSVFFLSCGAAIEQELQGSCLVLVVDCGTTAR